MTPQDLDGQIAKLNSWIEICDGDPLYQSYLREQREALQGVFKNPGEHRRRAKTLHRMLDIFYQHALDRTLPQRESMDAARTILTEMGHLRDEEYD